jgi:hypothetical protein
MTENNIEAQPPAAQQIEFLTNLQRLFSEGAFVATYKFALLSALADLCVENGRDTDEELEILTSEIAEKFITYYWRQIRPYTARSMRQEAILLRHSTGGEAAVVRVLRQRIEAGINSLSELKHQKAEWNQIVSDINGIVKKMPLWKLQTMGHSTVEFLYPNVMRGNSIRLKPGVMYCFRAFHTFITDMIRGAWLRFIRRHNQDRLGDPADLDEFLFGSERVSLAPYAPILREVQSSRCFYCGREIKPSGHHVDHFIPWATYPNNLGHNFVLADSGCNTAKSDHLAAVEHLERWCYRNGDIGERLGKSFDKVGIIHDQVASQTVAEWAYSRAFAVGAETFKAKNVFEPLLGRWKDAFQTGQAPL